MRASLLPLTLLSLASLVTPLAAQAQVSPYRLTASTGKLTYDAGNDLSYRQFRLTIDRELTRHFRVGLAASRSHIGPWHDDPSLLATPGQRGDEALYHLNVSGIFQTAPSKSAGEDWLGAWAEVDLGVVHSAGRAKIAVPDNSFYAAVVDKPTGPSVGGGAGLDLRILPRFTVRSGLLVWQDLIYGEALAEGEWFVGLATRI